MHWIATAALVVIAGCAVWFTCQAREFMRFWMKPVTVKNSSLEINLSRELIEYFERNFTRRRKTKKETVNGI